MPSAAIASPAVSSSVDAEPLVFVLGNANPWNSVRYGSRPAPKLYAVALFPCDDNYAGDLVETRRVLVLEHWEGMGAACVEVDRDGVPDLRPDSRHVLLESRFVLFRDEGGKLTASGSELRAKRRAYSATLSRPAAAPERPAKMPVTTAPAAAA